MRQVRRADGQDRVVLHVPGLRDQHRLQLDNSHIAASCFLVSSLLDRERLAALVQADRGSSVRARSPVE